MTINGTIEIQTTADLQKYIEFLRKEMIEVGLKYGLNSKEALIMSQELDRYLTICQKCCQKENLQ